MPFQIPEEKISHLGNNFFSSYKNIETSKFFHLQILRDGKAGKEELFGPSKPLYRIITSFSQENFNIVASSNDDQIFTNEWKFLKDELPVKMATEIPNMKEAQMEKWVVAFLTKKAMAEGAKEIELKDKYEDDSDRPDGTRGRRNSVRSSMSSRQASPVAIRNSSPPVKISSAPADINLSSLSSAMSSDDEDEPVVMASPALVISGGKKTPLLTVAVFNVVVLLLRDAQPSTFWAALVAINVLVYLFVKKIGKSNSFMVSITPVPVGRTRRVAARLPGKSRSAGLSLQGPLLSARLEGPENPRPLALTHVSGPTFQPCAGSLVYVRQVGYSVSRLKSPSEASIYQFLGADFIQTDNKIDNIARFITLPLPPNVSSEELEQAVAETPLPAFLVVNVQIPGYAPSMFGTLDGPGNQLVAYFGLHGEQRARFRQDTSASAALVRKFFSSFITEEKGQDGKDLINKRLKCIPTVTNLADPEIDGLGRIAKSSITAKNATPFMTGPNCHRFYRGVNYFEVDMDVHKYQYGAVVLLSAMRDHVQLIQANVHLLLQGETDDELPERTLASFQINKLGWGQARPLHDLYPKAKLA
jgi:hypothetical protein